MSTLVVRLAHVFRPFALVVILIGVAAPLAGCSGNPTVAPGASSTMTTSTASFAGSRESTPVATAFT